MSGRTYRDVLTIGNVDIYNVTSNPDGVLDAPTGSLAIQSAGGMITMWKNNGGTSWEQVGGDAQQIVDGNGDTGITTEQPLGTDTDTLAMFTAGSPAMWISQLQKVAIGAVSPSGFLDALFNVVGLSPVQPPLNSMTMAVQNSVSPGDNAVLHMIGGVGGGDCIIDFGNPAALLAGSLQWDASSRIVFAFGGSPALEFDDATGLITWGASVANRISIFPNPGDWVVPPTHSAQALDDLANFISGFHGPIL